MRPSARLENHFGVPPEFAAAWLADFRPDDGGRWFDFQGTAQVTKTPHRFRIEAALPFGRNVKEITLDSEFHWTAKGQVFDRRGRLYHRTQLDELATADGTGSLHRVQMWLEPQGLGARLTFAIGKGLMLRSLHRGFARIQVAMEEEFATGSRRP